MRNCPYSQCKKPHGLCRAVQRARSMTLGSNINRCHYGVYGPVMQQQRNQEVEPMHVYTVEEVTDLLIENITEAYAATVEGQAQLTRVAKAVTNESIEKRKKTSIQTRAATAFDKQLGIVAAKSPEKVEAFMAGRVAWIAKHITRKYGSDEE